MKYIIKKDTIIFSPEFNEMVDDELLVNYKKVIFSDYELTDDLFYCYSNNYFEGSNWIYSNFNKKLIYHQI